MVIRRGEIWWANLPEPEGSEPGYRRPVVIIQENDFNNSRLATVIGVVLTTNLRLEGAPGNVRLSKKITGLPQDSIANVTQLITVDKKNLTQKIKRLPQSYLSRVEAGLRLILKL